MAMGVVHKFTKGLVPTAQDSDLREYNDRCHGQAGGFNSLAKELQEVFPDHVVNKWLGHSGKVAEKHYLQVTDEHWGKAMESRPLTGSPIGTPTGPISRTDETTKPCDLLGSDGDWGGSDDPENRPSRNRINSDTPRKTNNCESLPPQSPPSDAIELLSIWAKLDEPARRDLLAVALGWVKVAP